MSWYYGSAPLASVSNLTVAEDVIVTGNICVGSSYITNNTHSYGSITITGNTFSEPKAPIVDAALPSLKTICRKTLFKDCKKNRELALFKALLCRRYEIDATEIERINAEMAQLLQ